MNQINDDAELIRQLGGPTQLAEKLAVAMASEKRMTPQRIQNWIKRGIPARIKVDYPQIFMRKLVLGQLSSDSGNIAPALANTAHTATENIAQGV